MSSRADGRRAAGPGQSIRQRGNQGMKVLCSIYRSPRKDGMYLYVPRDKGLAGVPEDLLRLFGKPEHSMDLILSPERKLAREDIHQVLENLQGQGYHLQMPPRQEDWVMHLPDELLTRNDPVCAGRAWLPGLLYVLLRDLLVQRPVVVGHAEQEQAAGEEVDDGGDPLAHVQAVGAEHAEEGQQYPGQVEVDPPGAEARIRLPVHGRDQKQVNDPAN